MLLQHAMIDEFDAPTLNHFVQSCAREIDRGSRLKQVKVVEIEQWIVQMPPQVGERKQALVRDETGSVNVARGMGRRQRFLEEEITNPALHRREFHGRLGRAEGKLLGTASQQLTANEQFVQSLFNDFLGRSGTINELDGWVALLPSVGAAGVGDGEAPSTDSRLCPARAFRLRRGLQLKLADSTGNSQ